MNEQNHELIDIVEQKMLASKFGRYIGKEKIQEALKHVVICESNEELRQKYTEKTGVNYDGYLGGFNNNGICYFVIDSDPHVVIHEVMHTLSSTFDKDGHRVKNGIDIVEDKQGFAVFVNEGLTEYLASQISNEDTGIYSEGTTLFEGIDNAFNRYYEDENALFQIYVENDVDKLKMFINDALPKKKLEKFIKQNFSKASKSSRLQELKEYTPFEYIYNDLLYLKAEQTQTLAGLITKGAKKLERKREFERKHPFLAKITHRKMRKKEKNQKLLLAPSTTDEELDLKESLTSLVKAPEEMNQLEQRDGNEIESQKKEAEERM